MKVITLWQPYASFIADGIKHYETRSWHTPLTGTIGIHAAKRRSNDQRDVLAYLQRKFPDQLGAYIFDELPFGCIIAKGQLGIARSTIPIVYKITELEKALGDYTEGRFAWPIYSVYKIAPISVNGKQGIWNYP